MFGSSAPRLPNFRSFVFAISVQGGLAEDWAADVELLGDLIIGAEDTSHPIALATGRCTAGAWAPLQCTPYWRTNAL